MRAVYLIDGDQLVQVCKEHDIGVKKATLPPLLMIDEEAFADLEDEIAPPDETANEATGPSDVKRFRDEMLGDRESGIALEEIATLLGLTEGTVRNYLCIPAKREVLGDRIRSEPEIRAKALAIVARRREGQG